MKVQLYSYISTLQNKTLKKAKPLANVAMLPFWIRKTVKMKSTSTVGHMDGYFSFPDGRNCLLDHGELFDKQEYFHHIQHSPGKQYSLDEQCQLLEGLTDKLCVYTVS